MKDTDIERLLSQCMVEPRKAIKAKIIDDAVILQVETVPPKEKRAAFIPPRRWAYGIAACCLFLLVLAGGVFALANEDYMQVYVDVNPSVFFSVNRFEKVVKATNLSEDAKALIGNTSFKGMDIDAAVEETICLFGDGGYLDNGELLITTTCKDENKVAKTQEKLAKLSEKVKKEKEYTVKINKGKFTDEEKDEAKELDIPPAKYNIICEIIEKDSSYTVDSLKDKNMKQLKDLLKALS